MAGDLEKMKEILTEMMLAGDLEITKENLMEKMKAHW